MWDVATHNWSVVSKFGVFVGASSRDPAMLSGSLVQLDRKLRIDLLSL